MVDFIGGLIGNHSASEDLAQEVFMHFLQQPDAFRRQSSILTYLFGIARNVVRQERRRQSKEKARYATLSQHLQQTREVPCPAMEAQHADCVRIIKAAVSGLKPAQAQAVELFHVKQMPLLKAAENAGCSLKAFDGRLTRARRKLRQKLSHLKPDAEDI